MTFVVSDAIKINLTFKGGLGRMETRRQSEGYL